MRVSQRQSTNTLLVIRQPATSMQHTSTHDAANIRLRMMQRVSHIYMAIASRQRRRLRQNRTRQNLIQSTTYDGKVSPQATNMQHTSHNRDQQPLMKQSKNMQSGFKKYYHTCSRGLQRPCRALRCLKSSRESFIAGHQHVLSERRIVSLAVLYKSFKRPPIFVAIPVNSCDRPVRDITTIDI